MKRILLLLLILLPLINNAQNAAAIDPTFQVESTFAQYGNVNAIAIQNDSKIVVAGLFSSYGENATNTIARVNEDNSIDLSFNSGSGFNATVECLALQADGKIIAGGQFTTYNGISARRIVRLNSDGSLDASFSTGTGFGSIVNDVKIQADGKILVGGRFSNYNGESVSKLIRLNTDGSIDFSFSTTNDVTSEVNSIAIKGNGKILVGSSSTLYSLNEDGTSDNSLSLPFLYSLKKVQIQPDGKILVAQSFSSLQRLNEDGTLDGTFQTNPLKTFENMELQPDGKIIVIGGFFDPGYKNDVERLNSDGSDDLGFNVQVFESNINALKLMPNGKILFGGTFANSQNTGSSIAQLNSNGSIDPTFISQLILSQQPAVFTIAAQSDGKILAGGQFTFYNSQITNRLIRFNEDGTEDSSFDTGTGFKHDNYGNAGIYSIAIQPDNKILVAGQFSKFNEIPIFTIARLNTNGSLDTSFSTSLNDPSRHFDFIKLLPDGKILAAGGFPDETVKTLMQFNSDGTTDTSFNILEFNDEVLTLAIQPDGKIVIGGFFSTCNGNDVSGLMRLNPNGTIDTTFLYTADFYTVITSIIVRPNGKIIASGFVIENENGTDSLISLNNDGSIDVSFESGVTNGIINSLLLQDNGKLLIVGTFTTYAQTASNYLIQLNELGIPDTTGFDIGSGFNQGVTEIIQQADSKFVAAGGFTTYDGQIARKIVRLQGTNLSNESFGKNSVSFYPNPVKDNIMIVNDSANAIIGYDVFDFSGKKILSDSGISSINQINVTHLSKGIYIIKMNSATSEWTSKFVKE